MKIEINKELFVEELKKVLIDKFGSVEVAKKMNIKIIENRIFEEMTTYVMNRYKEFYSDSLADLINAKNYLITECLEDIIS